MALPSGGQQQQQPSARAASPRRSQRATQAQRPHRKPSAHSGAGGGMLSYTMPLPDQAVGGAPDFFEEPAKEAPDRAYLRQLGLHTAPVRNSRAAAYLTVAEPGRMHHGQLSKAIQGATTWQRIARLVERHEQDFSHVHITNALRRLWQDPDIFAAMRAALSAEGHSSMPAPGSSPWSSATASPAISSDSDAESSEGAPSPRGRMSATWLLRKLTAMSQQRVDAFDPQALSQVPKALAKFGHRDDRLMAAIQEAALEQAGSFDANHVISMMAALGIMRITPPTGWLHQFLDDSRHVLRLANEHQLPLLLWGVAKLPGSVGQPSAEWWTEYFECSKRLLTGAKPHDLGATAWALGKLRARPHRSWLNLLLDATELALPGCTARDLGHMAWGMSQVGAQPDGDWFFALCDRASQLLTAGSLNAEELGQVLFGLAELRKAKRLRQEAAAAEAASAQQQQQPGTPEAEAAVAAAAASAALQEPAAAAAAADRPPSPKAYVTPRWRRADAAQELLVRVALQVHAPQLASCPPSAISNMVVAAAELAAPDQASAFASAAAEALQPHWSGREMGRPHWMRHLRRTLLQLGVTPELLPPSPVNAAAAAS